MLNYKKILLDLDIATDCEYLDKYIEIITSPDDLSEGYEKHHIIPRSYFKKNLLEIDNSENNIVKLSHYNHLLAHYYAALSFISPVRESMIYAFNLMVNENIDLYNDSEKIAISKLSYIAELRKAFCEQLKNREISEETLLKMSKSWFKKGVSSWNKGIPMREESKAKLREHNLGKPNITEAVRKRISNNNSHPKSKETRDKMSKYSKNRSASHLKHLSDAAKGNAHAFDGMRNRRWKKDLPLPDGWEWGWK